MNHVILPNDSLHVFLTISGAMSKMASSALVVHSYRLTISYGLLRRIWKPTTTLSPFLPPIPTATQTGLPSV